MTSLEERRSLTGYQGWVVISCQEGAGHFKKEVSSFFCEEPGFDRAVQVPEMGLLQRFVALKTQTRALVKPLQSRKL